MAIDDGVIDAHLNVIASIFNYFGSQWLQLLSPELFAFSSLSVLVLDPVVLVQQLLDVFH